eukprot:COSAG06_NODE_57852_length_279_cov_0.572222_1_plen_26_part_01
MKFEKRLVIASSVHYGNYLLQKQLEM